MKSANAMTLLCRAAATLGFCALLSACSLTRFDPSEEERLACLRAELAPHLEVLGARNWIVVADPTCPILAGEGVDVLVVEADATDVFREVLTTLSEQAHLTPRVWVCSEMNAVPETRAPGIRRYRRELHSLLRGCQHYEVTERVIGLQLAQAAQTYRILYIKTDTPLPYSSIAIELDSGYWNSSDEAELRERMERVNKEDSRKKPLPRPKPSDYSRYEA